MTQYVGLDISPIMTALCVVGRPGALIRCNAASGIRASSPCNLVEPAPDVGPAIGQGQLLRRSFLGQRLLDFLEGQLELIGKTHLLRAPPEQAL